jgi:hypothetical protein
MGRFRYVIHSMGQISANIGDPAAGRGTKIDNIRIIQDCSCLPSREAYDALRVERKSN